MGKLNKISITSADDKTSQNELLCLTEKFPFVEWGILYFPEREGGHRNPTADWKKEFLSVIPKRNTALHLCGVSVFKNILKDDFEKSQLKEEFDSYGRLQLNINARKLNHLFTDAEIAEVYDKLLACNFEIIAQFNTVTENAVRSYIQKNVVNKKKFHVLLDSSLGRGVCPDSWSVPDIFNDELNLGFAGGLNPENIFEAYNSIDKITATYFWLDLESGARTDNEFDLDKVQRILSIFNGLCIES